MKIFKRCKLVVSHRDAAPQFSPAEQERFHACLARECARSDRSNQVFSLVIFSANGNTPRKSAWQLLFGHLNERLRTTDLMGWFAKDQAAVVLYNTGFEEANRLALRTINHETLRDVHLVPMVFTYPDRFELPRQTNLYRGHAPSAVPSAVPSSAPSSVQDPADPVQARAVEVAEAVSAPAPADPAAPAPSAEQENFHNDVQALLFGTIPFWKRAMDLCGSLVLLTLLAPLMLTVALCIKLQSPGPALFRQTRVGACGRIFTLYKFRSMHPQADCAVHRKHLEELLASCQNDDGRPMQKLENDNRVFPMGKLLRKSSLDELPQLINVLMGDMSMVGPRPPIPYEVSKYARWYHRRLDVIPGMTGLWQVSGKNRLTFTEMMRLDIQYANTLSPLGDLRILLKTPGVVLGQMLENRSRRRFEASRHA